jgi:FtsZ-binding cell division protein ZapB
MMDSASAPQVDALARLEERVHRAAELVVSLRRERDEAREQAAKLTQEMETLRAERAEVRTRIEKLLGQMDVLSAG